MDESLKQGVSIHLHSDKGVHGFAGSIEGA